MAENIPNLEWKVIKRPKVALNPHIFGDFDYEEDSSDDDCAVPIHGHIYHGTSLMRTHVHS